MLESKLIIFDCDGVLVDTEPLTNRVLAQCVTDAGWPVDTQFSIDHFKGRDLSDILADVESHLGIKLPNMMADYRVRMYEQIKSCGVPALDGIHKLLDTLDHMKADAPNSAPDRCVATNAPLKKVTLTLTGAKLINRFTHPTDSTKPTMFSAYEVGKWKPDPALFLHAAESMGHPPKDCIVVEDSVSGVTAAANANMRVIGIASLTPASDLLIAGATQIIKSHHELIAELQAT